MDSVRDRGRGAHSCSAECGGARERVEGVLLARDLCERSECRLVKVVRKTLCVFRHHGKSFALPNDFALTVDERATAGSEGIGWRGCSLRSLIYIVIRLRRVYFRLWVSMRTAERSLTAARSTAHPSIGDMVESILHCIVVLRS